MQNNPKITIAVACLNEEIYIAECLDSLIAQDYPGEFEIIVADGGSEDKTIEIIEDYSSRYDQIKLINNSKKIQAAGRNLVFKAAESDYLAYLDAHSYAEPNWLSQLWTEFEKRMKKEKLAAIGSIHKPASNQDFPFAVSRAFNSHLGGGISGSYSDKDEVELVDSAYACLYSRAALEIVGFYDEKFAVGEDLELNLRLKEKGYNIYANPKAVTYYYHRESFQPLLEQMNRYGFWRAKVNKLHPNNSLITIIPSVFVLLLIASLLLSFIFPILFLLFIAIMLGYFTVIFLSSLSNSITYGRNMFAMVMIYSCIHFGYGFGFIKGILKK
jgi:cellulose synthase/poly-beta-1,6-N-acetylglucosamine synthase-like glycosyltransferase